MSAWNGLLSNSRVNSKVKELKAVISLRLPARVKTSVISCFCELASQVQFQDHSALYKVILLVIMHTITRNEINLRVVGCLERVYTSKRRLFYLVNT